MKRSEVVKIIAEALGKFTAPAYPVAEEVLERLEGPLSIDYDPEEPLPERLEFQEGTNYCRAAASDTTPSRRCLLANIPSDDRILREAVRRWNAWPELERLHAELLSCGRRGFAEVVRRFLDGKEGE